MPLHAQLVHDWAASWVFAAMDAQHTLQERTGVGQRPAAESGMPRSICYLLPWPPGWCCSRQPCSCGGETTVVWTRRNHRRWELLQNIEKAGDGRQLIDVSSVSKASFGPTPPQTSSVPPQNLVASPLGASWRCSLSCGVLARHLVGRSKGNREGMRTRVKNLRILEAMIDCD